MRLCKRLALFPLAVAYRVGAWLHRLRWFRKKRAARPVISIGNLVVGGGGKTSFVALLAAQFPGSAVCVKGYQARRRVRAPRILRAGERLDPAEFGDEAVLLHNRLPDNTIVVCWDKTRAARYASAEHPLIFIDDGFQHHKLHRDLDIVCLNGDAPFGDGQFLPLGRLRDDPRRLKCADYLVINNVYDAADFERVKREVARYTSAPCIGVCYRPEEPLPKRAAAFCGIGHPEGFFALLKRSGIQLVCTQVAADHRLPSPADFEAFAQRAMQQGAEALLCTEKDSVKLSKKLQSALPIKEVKVRLDVQFGQLHFHNLCHHLRSIIQHPM